MFLDLLRKECQQMCAHSNEYFSVQIETLQGNRTLRCSMCGFCLNMDHFLCHQLNCTKSFSFAEAYVQWTGDTQIRCIYCLDSTSLRHRIQTDRCLFSNFSHLTTTHHLLKALHAPLSKDISYCEIITRFDTGNIGLSSNETELRDLFKKLYAHLQALIHRIASENDDVARSSIGLMIRSILHLILYCISNIGEDLFDVYYKVLVPHVKRCLDAEPETIKCQKNSVLFSRNEFTESHSTSSSSNSNSLSDDLSAELARSGVVYNVYSSYCVQFDAIHVAVVTLLFQENLSAVYNIILTFTVRWLLGLYESASCSWIASNSMALSIADILHQQHPKYEIYLKQFRREIDHLLHNFSDNFFTSYYHLETEVSLAVVEELIESSYEKSSLFRFEFQKAFPRILLEGKHFSDLYAFQAALLYHTSKSRYFKKHNTTKEDNSVKKDGFYETSKGVISACKSIFIFLKKCMLKVNGLYDILFMLTFPHFEDAAVSKLNENNNPVPRDSVIWCRQVIEYFLESDKDFEKDLIQALQDLCEWLVSEKKSTTETTTLQDCDVINDSFPSSSFDSLETHFPRGEEEEEEEVEEDVEEQNERETRKMTSNLKYNILVDLDSPQKRGIKRMKTTRETFSFKTSKTTSHPDNIERGDNEFIPKFSPIHSPDIQQSQSILQDPSERSSEKCSGSVKEIDNSINIIMETEDIFDSKTNKTILELDQPKSVPSGYTLDDDGELPSSFFDTDNVI